MTKDEALELACETLRDKAESLILSERAVALLGKDAAPADRKNVWKRKRLLEAITVLKGLEHVGSIL